jgi:hypothetical protein
VKESGNSTISGLGECVFTSLLHYSLMYTFCMVSCQGPKPWTLNPETDLLLIVLVPQLQTLFPDVERDVVETCRIPLGRNVLHLEDLFRV